MSVYKKLNTARVKFHASEIKKTGKNAFSGFSYLQLDDFLVRALQIFEEVGICAVVSFGTDVATMKIFDTEGDGVITIESPMAEAPLKGCHPIQQMGAVETYQRRYLWVSALEIVEHDAIDATSGRMEDAERSRLSDILAGLTGAKNAADWAKWKQTATDFCLEHGKREYTDIVKQTIDAKVAAQKKKKEPA